ncbi:flagellar biosynthetic protein FliO [Desulforamulus ruminis]|uniref:Flagellar protein n=1 Tax=Desulforamulus ruminis (strain ATCC 23193 / DSM 2154 / NCIMB 8452 / DL) TaxID=696281 RepID=F6DNS8_DESRL|nr:flagellar biosynthetic protein FliO [Desulforamulus ruminis]AEG59523.1 hypothetical protein Desru_1249 [Desulforamulus ruminis DSM 2154]
MDKEILWLFIRVLVLLPLILFLAYITIKFGLARNRVFSTGKRYMRTVENLPLGSKGGLTLVEIGGRYYLFALQEGRISLVKEFESLPEPLSFDTDGTAPVAEFSDVLSQKMKHFSQQLSQQYRSGWRRKGKSGSGCPESDQKREK